MPQGWHVVQQRQTTDLTPDGRFVDIMEITVETVELVTFTLKVPISSYSPETVAQLASARAAQISAVHNL
jgi:hypothetical protein